MNSSKKFVLSILSLLSFQIAEAQDKLYKVNGNVLEVKVTDISNRTVSYKRVDNINGPTYTIGRNEIEKIQYENGNTEYYNNRRPVNNNGNSHRDRVVSPAYGANIIAFAPVQMTNTSATGLGVHYERFFEKKGIFSIYIPLALSFRNEQYNNYNSNNDNEVSHVFWTYPGVKIYPTGSNKVVSYGVGPSLAIGAGTVPVHESIFDPSTQTYINKTSHESIFQLGMMVNNSINIQPTPKLYMGAELGLGMPYIYANSRSNYGDQMLVQFNFKIGYRF